MTKGNGAEAGAPADGCEAAGAELMRRREAAGTGVATVRRGPRRSPAEGRFTTPDAGFGLLTAPDDGGGHHDDDTRLSRRGPTGRENRRR